MAEHLILLAAGSARRFGTNKLLRPVNGKPLYAHGLAALLAAAKMRPAADVTVVSRTPEILAAARAAGAKAVESPLSEQGLSFTIKAALDALEPLAEGDYLLFAVADQPYLTAASVAALLERPPRPPAGPPSALAKRWAAPLSFPRRWPKTCGRWRATGAGGPFCAPWAASACGCRQKERGSWRTSTCPGS